MSNLAREKQLEEIIAIETEMLTSMKVEEPVPANTLPAFKKMRWMTYSVLSDQTISMWYEDIKQAKASGRNIMLEKYAMIGGQIPLPKRSNENYCCGHDFTAYAIEIPEPLCADAEIEKIVTIEARWQEEIAKKYSKAIKRESETAKLFKKYAVCELHTWSEETVHSYWEDVERALNEGRNLAEERYDNLYASLGKGSLKQVNDSLL